MTTVKLDKSAPAKKAKKPEATEKKVEQKVSSKTPTDQKNAESATKDKAKTLKKSPSKDQAKKSLKEPLKPKSGMIIIKQIGSPIRRDPRQTLYLKSLGLGKINRMRQVIDNSSTRGLLDKLRHMVVVTEQ